MNLLYTGGQPVFFGGKHEIYRKEGKVFIFELKVNRLVTDNGWKRNQGQFEKLDRMGL